MRALTVLLVLGLALRAASAGDDSHDTPFFPGGPAATYAPGIKPSGGNMDRRLLQADNMSVPDVLEDPKIAPGPGRRTTIVTSSTTPGPGQQITVATIQDGKLSETTMSTVPASPPTALSAGRKLLQEWGGKDAPSVAAAAASGATSG